MLAGAVANHGQVVRVGDTVRRPLAPCHPATHALLRHLEVVGFNAAPRLLGADDRYESLSWIPGRAGSSPLPDWLEQDSTLASVAELVRGFHRASRSLDPADRQWPIPVPPAYRGGAVSHNDLHPGNIIFADDRAVGLIDFDLAGPGSEVWDLATLVRCWAPLVADEDLPGPMAAEPHRRLQRIMLIFEAYGLPVRLRRAVIDALLDNHDWTYRIVTDAARVGHPGFAAYWSAVGQQTGRARAWLQAHQPWLRAMIG